MTPLAALQPMLSEALDALDLPPERAERLAIERPRAFESRFAVASLAAASIGAAGLAAADLLGTERVAVDGALACGWFAWSVRPVGWEQAATWDPIAGDYPSADGWVRLHTNAPRHRAAALAALDCAPEREAVAAAVRARGADEVEAAVVATGGCAATMRSLAEWHEHPQGRTVAAEPLIATACRPAPTPLARQANRRADPLRPLAGLRVLDLTRVLAGPVATRFLAGLGAQVLRIDPPDWDEPAVLPDVTVGKRCARLDLRNAAGREAFVRLLESADVLVHGYRPGALDGLGLGEEVRRALNPRMVEVALSAYGWTGPWRERRGFDSLLQMSAGIADAGMAWKKADRPVPLPVQALDHATGYLMAAAALRGLARLEREGLASSSRLSLARTAALLTEHGTDTGQPFAGAQDSDYAEQPEQTAWGPLLRLRPPLTFAGTPMHWDLPAGPLGTAEARWEM